MQYVKKVEENEKFMYLNIHFKRKPRLPNFQFNTNLLEGMLTSQLTFQNRVDFYADSL